MVVLELSFKLQLAVTAVAVSAIALADRKLFRASASKSHQLPPRHIAQGNATTVKIWVPHIM